MEGGGDFDLYDVNADGVLSGSEIQKFMKAKGFSATDEYLLVSTRPQPPPRLDHGMP